jgi:hypothetical protein
MSVGLVQDMRKLDLALFVVSQSIMEVLVFNSYWRDIVI